MGVFTLAAFIALCGLVTPFLGDHQIGYRPGFTIVFFITIAVAGWIGVGAGPIGRRIGAWCAASPRLSRALRTKAVSPDWGEFEIGAFLRLVGWPLALGLGVGFAYARVMGL